MVYGLFYFIFPCKPLKLLIVIDISVMIIVITLAVLCYVVLHVIRRTKIFRRLLRQNGMLFIASFSAYCVALSLSVSIIALLFLLTPPTSTSSQVSVTPQ